MELGSIAPSAFAFPGSLNICSQISQTTEQARRSPWPAHCQALFPSLCPFSSAFLRSTLMLGWHLGPSSGACCRVGRRHGRGRTASLEKCPPGESAAWLGWEASKKLPKPQIICSYTVSLGNVLLRNSSWWLSACFLSLFLSCSSFHNSCALLTSGGSYM